MSRIIHVDKKYRFVSMFDPDTGFYMRTGVLDENGEDTGVDPFMASSSELIDVGVMGRCINGKLGLCKAAGVQCYQSGGSKSLPNMAIDDFRSIVEQSRGKVFQIALGGRGDPDCHENFEDILRLCRENDIVPNFTTSGIQMTAEKAALCKKMCGAVAVSWYRNEHTQKAIRMLLEAGVKTNIHYVLGNNTIDEAIDRLSDQVEYGPFPRGINAVIFLAHKPVGEGEQKNVLRMGDPRVERFFSLIDKGGFEFKIGFDSCSVPGLINHCTGINEDSYDTCEGGRWSMYISADMKALPCSFDQDHRWAFDLRTGTIADAWKSPQFEDFRNRFRTSCPGCSKQATCMGGCPIKQEIVLCDRPEKNLAS